jgi:hypothetical protein
MVAVAGATEVGHAGVQGDRRQDGPVPRLAPRAHPPPPGPHPPGGHPARTLLGAAAGPPYGGHAGILRD